MRRLILSVDAGTSSFRTALYDDAGHMVEGSLNREVYALETDAEGRATLSAQKILYAFDTCLQKTLEFVKDDVDTRIEAAGISFFWHSLVGLNSQGDAVTPVITWADGRCRGEAEKLRQKWNERVYHASTGCMIRSAFWPAKLVWMKKNHASLWKKVSQWISPSELILHRMTGKAVLSHSMAAGTGLYDQRQKGWSLKWCKSLGIKAHSLPEISNSGYRTSEGLAKIYPQLKETHWFGGIGDGAASNLGLGATDGKIVAINFGTSAAIRVLSPMPKKAIPFGLFCYRLDEERVLVGGAITNAGIVRAWFDREYGVPADKTEISSKTNLWSLPFLAPERAPTWPEELPGMTIGFQLESNKQEHYDSLIDATLFRLNRIRMALQKWSGKKLSYRLGGGLAGTGEMIQKFADVLSSPVAIVEESEASIRGAAIYALLQLGEKPPSPQEVKRYLPHPKAAAEYQKKTLQQEIIEEEYREFFKRCKKRGVKI
ncbi:MAG: FGGY family carbohydrate kinase [Verrucomicrobiota bacterium]